MIYALLGICGAMMFGGQIIVKGSNLILNINEEYKVDPNRWESFLLRILFMIVLACHVPFIFFSGKESWCIIVDELDRQSVSKTLDKRIAILEAQEKAEHLKSTMQNVIGSEVSKKGPAPPRPSYQSMIRATLQPLSEHTQPSMISHKQSA